jgi:aminoglycoside phosphotransferase (APT) family kinase protein
VTAEVLARYGPAIAGLRWVPVEGGFSGALVWRGDDFALKAYPPHVTPEHVAQVHGWMRKAAHLPFVPAVVPTTSHATLATHAGRVWEVVGWMPGEPGLSSSNRVTNAVAALAQLHRAWEPSPQALAPCPAVRRRIDLLGRSPTSPHRQRPEWRSTTSSATQVSGQDTAAVLQFRAADAVTRLAPHAARALAPHADRLVPVQPCLCDVHAEHLLFTGDCVTGVIDFGATKTDHVAVDLARLLGSADIDESNFFRGVSEYQARARGRVEPAFVRLLDYTGVVCARSAWAARPAEVLVSPRVRERLAGLLARAEALTPAHFSVPS